MASWERPEQTSLRSLTLHFNDLGNNALAKVITAKLGLAQEKYAQRKVTPIKLV